MRLHQLEARVHQIIDRVTSSSPIEDARVELKAIWIDPVKAARQLAAHANGAHGEPILWLIGADEKAATVAGAEAKELATWLPQLQAQFDLVHPELLQHLAVPVQVGVAVVALLFDTRQAPYVVKNPAHGVGPDPVAWEVPWRDGARTRTARRSELLRILAPLQLLPEIDLMEAVLCVRLSTASEDKRQVMAWDLSAAAYFAPQVNGDIVLPFHRAYSTVAFEGSELVLPLHSVQIGPEMELPPFPTVRQWGSRPPTEPKAVRSECVLRSPGRLLITGRARTEVIEALPSQGAELTARLGVVGAEQDLTIRWDLQPWSREGTDYIRKWGFVPSSPRSP